MQVEDSWDDARAEASMRRRSARTALQARRHLYPTDSVRAMRRNVMGWSQCEEESLKIKSEQDKLDPRSPDGPQGLDAPSPSGSHQMPSLPLKAQSPAGTQSAASLPPSAPNPSQRSQLQYRVSFGGDTGKGQVPRCFSKQNSSLSRVTPQVPRATSLDRRKPQSKTS